MRNLLFEIAYQGTRYHGYQVQENALSVAQVLQDAIEAVTGSRDDITGCSRTDTGVHANSFYFNMKTESRIPEDRFPIALNHALPPDIAVKRCQEVPMEFHARYHCLRKEYLYRIWNSEIRSPFWMGWSASTNTRWIFRACKRRRRILSEHTTFGRFVRPEGKRWKRSARSTRLLSAGKRTIWFAFGYPGTVFCIIWCGSWSEHY